MRGRAAGRALLRPQSDIVEPNGRVVAPPDLAELYRTEQPGAVDPGKPPSPKPSGSHRSGRPGRLPPLQAELDAIGTDGTAVLLA